MVRPERRDFLAGERPVRVSAGAPGSRPQSRKEISGTRAGRQEPVEGQGARKRAATLSERCKPRNSISRKVFGRAEPLISRRRQQTVFCRTGWNTGPLRGMGGGTFSKRIAEQERPYLAAWSGKDRGYKAGRPKSRGAGRESEGFVVPGKACNTTRWREGTLL